MEGERSGAGAVPVGRLREGLWMGCVVEEEEKDDDDNNNDNNDNNDDDDDDDDVECVVRSKLEMGVGAEIRFQSGTVRAERKRGGKHGELAGRDGEGGGFSWVRGCVQVGLEMGSEEVLEMGSRVGGCGGWLGCLAWWRRGNHAMGGDEWEHRVRV